MTPEWLGTLGRIMSDVSEFAATGDYRLAGALMSLSNEARQAAEQLRRTPERRWTLAELARSVHLSPSQLGRVFVDAYGKAPFVRIQSEVALANIVGSNFVDLSFIEGTDGKVLVQGALDNIVKGAGGSAVQNMNLMFGLKGTEGLINLSPLYP